MAIFFRAIIPVVMLSFLAVGCASAPPMAVPEEMRQKLMPFLRDGATKKEEVLARLGKPSAEFESGRILAYKLKREIVRGFWAAEVKGVKPSYSPNWEDVEYNLILVFDEEGILRKHRLLVL